MIPFGVHTVTLLHRANTGCARYVVDGCSWRMREITSVADNSRTKVIETTCRMPVNSVKPFPGDLLIMGDVQVEANSETELVRLYSQLKSSGIAAFRINRVSDNTNGAPLPHYAASGE